MLKTIVTGLILISLFNFSCLAQQKQYKFRLDGELALDTGRVVFELVADSSYYPENMRHLSANIINGKFNLSGMLQNPLAYKISINNRSFLSGLFVLDKGDQTIKLDLKSNNSTPYINNKVMQLDYLAYKKAYLNVSFKRKTLDSEWDSLEHKYKNNIPPNIQETLDFRLKKNYEESDSTLLKFVSSHPNSYYALWRLINLTSFGYYEIFDSINAKLSDSLKNSYSGNFLRKYLKDANFNSLSKAVHKLAIVGINNNKIDSIDYSAHKYTLLDFWYSHCGPCIAQFKEMNLLYHQFHAKGFEIIGISTDSEKDKINWLKTIKVHDLKWPQFLDLDGVESAKLSIKAFPSNLLVNENGKIEAINLLPSELAVYLNAKL